MAIQKKTTKTKSTFDVLYGINVNDKTEKKGSLTYLSWASAWAEAKKLHPKVNYKVYEDESMGVNYFHDGRSAWVKVGVAIDNLEHINYLPVMDFRNKSIPLDSVTSMDVNKAIQRCLTKALALHGLGLYIYEGEDMPENDEPIVEDVKVVISKNGNTKLSIPVAKWNKMKGFAKANKDNQEAIFDAIAMQKIVLTDFMKTELTKILK